MTKIISIANTKGGTGKSTLTVLLAGALASDLNKKVVVLDCDSQGSIKSLLELERTYNEGEPLFEVQTLAPAFVRDFLSLKGSTYDFIFIDVPRFTVASGDSSTMQVLSFCDVVLIPVLGSTLEILSTKDFIKSVKTLADYKSNNGIEFNYFGVLNRDTRRSENNDTRQILSSEIEMFNSSLSDLKIFSNVSCFDSVLSSNGGKKRFAPFYNEFLNKIT